MLNVNDSVLLDVFIVRLLKQLLIHNSVLENLLSLCLFSRCGLVSCLCGVHYSESFLHI